MSLNGTSLYEAYNPTTGPLPETAMRHSQSAPSMNSNTQRAMLANSSDLQTPINELIKTTRLTNKTDDINPGFKSSTGPNMPPTRWTKSESDKNIFIKPKKKKRKKKEKKYKTMDSPPWWVYLIIGLLILMSSILAFKKNK